MNTIQEKNFFSPSLHHYNFDLTKRWRVEYDIPTHNGNGSKRVVLYGKINKGKTIEDRLTLYNETIDRLSLSTENPHKKNLSVLDTAIEKNVFLWRKKTIEAYKTVINEYQKFLGIVKPEAANVMTIQNFLLHLHNNKKSKNTIAKYRNTLFTIYKKAIGLKLCTENPVIEIPGIKRNPKSLYYFTDEQIKKIKQNLRGKRMDQLRLCVQLIYYCYIRNNEIRNLKICDINFEYGFIEILNESAKNNRTQKVQIPKKFLSSISYLKNYSNNCYVISKDLQPGTDQVSAKWIYSEHKKILDDLKIRGRYSFYSWKHTGVAKAIKAGVNLKDLQLQLRHHSLEMVDQYAKNLGVMDSTDIRDKFPEW